MSILTNLLPDKLTEDFLNYKNIIFDVQQDNIVNETNEINVKPNFKRKKSEEEVKSDKKSNKKKSENVKKQTEVDKSQNKISSFFTKK